MPEHPNIKKLTLQEECNTFIRTKVIKIIDLFECLSTS